MKEHLVRVRFMAAVTVIVLIAVGALAGVSQGSVGQSVVQGKVNVVGAATTSLSASGVGPAFLAKNTGTGNGVSASTGDPGHDGLLAANSASSHGSGAAIEAVGGNDSGLTATTVSASSRAVRGINAASTGQAVGVYGGSKSANGFGVYSAGNLGVSAGHTIECESCVTVEDLNLLQVFQALEVRINREQFSPGHSSTLHAFGPWTLTANCRTDPAGPGTIASITLQNDETSMLSVNSGPAERFKDLAPTPLAQTSAVSAGGFAGVGGAFTAAEIPFTDHVEGQVMAAVDADPTDFPNGPKCIFTFSGSGD